jgi:membrane protein implicated in regulation of membrane protease activity
MGAQEIATFLIVAAAVVWLAARWRRRRRSGTCCGEKECPALRSTVERLKRT